MHLALYEIKFWGTIDWSKVDKPDSCWRWTGKLTQHGYGTTTPPKQRRAMAHRVAYELLIGPIPDGLVLDHLCRNRACVNPGHLEPVTSAENLWRIPGHGNATHCKQGHEWTEENTVRYPRPDGSRNHRVCRACQRAGWTRSNQKRRNAGITGIPGAENF